MVKTRKQVVTENSIKNSCKILLKPTQSKETTTDQHTKLYKWNMTLKESSMRFTSSKTMKYIQIKNKKYKTGWLIATTTSRILSSMCKIAIV